MRCWMLLHSLCVRAVGSDWDPSISSSVFASRVNHQPVRHYRLASADLASCCSSNTRWRWPSSPVSKHTYPNQEHIGPLKHGSRSGALKRPVRQLCNWLRWCKRNASPTFFTFLTDLHCFYGPELDRHPLHALESIGDERVPRSLSCVFQSLRCHCWDAKYLKVSQLLSPAGLLHNITLPALSTEGQPVTLQLFKMPRKLKNSRGDQEALCICSLSLTSIFE